MTHAITEKQASGTYLRSLQYEDLTGVDSVNGFLCRCLENNMFWSAKVMH